MIIRKTALFGLLVLLSGCGYIWTDIDVIGDAVVVEIQEATDQCSCSDSDGVRSGIFVLNLDPDESASAEVVISAIDGSESHTKFVTLAPDEHKFLACKVESRSPGVCNHEQTGRVKKYKLYGNSNSPWYALQNNSFSVEHFAADMAECARECSSPFGDCLSLGGPAAEAFLSPVLNSLEAVDSLVDESLDQAEVASRLQLPLDKIECERGQYDVRSNSIYNSGDLCSINFSEILDAPLEADLVITFENLYVDVLTDVNGFDDVNFARFPDFSVAPTLTISPPENKSHDPYEISEASGRFSGKIRGVVPTDYGAAMRTVTGCVGYVE